MNIKRNEYWNVREQVEMLQLENQERFKKAFPMDSRVEFRLEDSEEILPGKVIGYDFTSDTVHVENQLDGEKLWLYMEWIVQE